MAPLPEEIRVNYTLGPNDWEYLQAQLYTAHGSQVEVDGKPTTFERLGRDGWELVCIVLASDPWHVAYFKRPRTHMIVVDRRVEGE